MLKFVKGHNSKQLLNLRFNLYLNFSYSLNEQISVPIAFLIDVFVVLYVNA